MPPQPGEQLDLRPCFPCRPLCLVCARLAALLSVSFDASRPALLFAFAVIEPCVAGFSGRPAFDTSYLASASDAAVCVVADVCNDTWGTGLALC